MSSDLVLSLLSGAAGGTAALAGQLISQRGAKRQHAEDLRQRSEEHLASFALPIAARRAEALEELFDLLQQAIEDRSFTLTQYQQTRRLLIHVPAPLSQELVSGVAALLKARREESAERTELAIESLRKVQQGLRSAAGLEAIDRYVRRLDELRAAIDSPKPSGT
jgi:hypothetical protein